jgi:sterol desaturase/sphingolipid hydroxylase (fatty acid hydroxylase superfamily)
MDYVAYAIPFFLAAIVLELAWGLLRRRNTYRLNDSINSLSLGIISTSVKLVSLGLGGIALQGVGAYAPLSMPVDSPLTWVFAFLFYDFCYYWFHRISHERQLFWASHVAHHQSEEYNLTTALRQTGTSFLGWIFYVPMFFLGVPLEVFVTVGSLNLIYQFWVHTMHVPKLGPLEWVFVTPSNHRVHHAQNPRYIDRNHGGVFIIWDRLFGTFQEELDDEPVVFGITRPLRSWNPLWANVHVYWQMLRDCLAARSLREKLYVWVAPNGWRPQGAEQAYPLPRSDSDGGLKYDPPMGRGDAAYALLQFLLVLAAAVWMLDSGASLPLGERLAYFGILLWTLFAIGRALEGRLNRQAETARLAALVALPALFGAGALTWALLIAAVSGGLLFTLPGRFDRTRLPSQAVN